MAKPGYLPCNGKCGKMVPPRSQLGGRVMCAPCRAERQGFDQIFWAHNPLRKRPWEYWRFVREIQAEERRRTLANAPSPTPSAAPDPDPNDPTDERNKKGGYDPGIFQFDESTFTNGRAYNSGNAKSVYDRDAKRAHWGLKTKVISVAQWTKSMRKPSEKRYREAMDKQHAAQTLAIRREQWPPVLADVFARGGSANQMEAYRLRAVEGLTQAETARKMRCSEKNVEKLVNKSKRWLGVQTLSRFCPV